MERIHLASPTTTTTSSGRRGRRPAFLPRLLAAALLLSLPFSASGQVTFSRGWLSGGKRAPSKEQLLLRAFLSRNNNNLSLPAGRDPPPPRFAAGGDAEDELDVDAGRVAVLRGGPTARAAEPDVLAAPSPRGRIAIVTYPAGPRFVDAFFGGGLDDELAASEYPGSGASWRRFRAGQAGRDYFLTNNGEASQEESKRYPSSVERKLLRPPAWTKFAFRRHLFPLPRSSVSGGGGGGTGAPTSSSRLARSNNGPPTGASEGPQRRPDDPAVRATDDDDDDGDDGEDQSRSETSSRGTDGAAGHRTEMTNQSDTSLKLATAKRNGSGTSLARNKEDAANSSASRSPSEPEQLTDMGNHGGRTDDHDIRISPFFVHVCRQFLSPLLGKSV